MGRYPWVPRRRWGWPTRIVAARIATRHTVAGHPGIETERWCRSPSGRGPIASRAGASGAIGYVVIVVRNRHAIDAIVRNVVGRTTTTAAITSDNGAAADVHKT